MVCGHQLLAQTAKGEGGVQEEDKNHSDGNNPGFRISIWFLLITDCYVLELTPVSFPPCPCHGWVRRSLFLIRKHPVLPLSCDLSQYHKVSSYQGQGLGRFVFILHRPSIVLDYSSYYSELSRGKRGERERGRERERENKLRSIKVRCWLMSLQTLEKNWKAGWQTRYPGKSCHNNLFYSKSVGLNVHNIYLHRNRHINV